MNRFRLLILCLVLLGGASSNLVTAESMVELQTSQGTYSGKPFLFNKQVCWLVAQDGSYSGVLFQDVTRSRKLPDSYYVRTSVEHKSTLQKELGKSFEVKTFGNLVVAAPQGRATEYARLIDRISRHFSRYASVRRLPIVKPVYPLTTIIYPSQKEFMVAAGKSGQKANRTLKGYYHPLTNRVMMFEERKLYPQQKNIIRPNELSSVSDQTIATLIHESIHQFAFNQGLHSRIGVTPRWIIEGLANMLEASTEFNQTKQGLTNINQSRLLRFQEFREQRRRTTIADYIVDDEQYFRSNNLDAYSQAWALTYFLAEEYPSAYANYLKIVAARDPLDNQYPPEEKLADFQKAFGKDIAWLEVKFLRFMDRL